MLLAAKHRVLGIDPEQATSGNDRAALISDHRKQLNDGMALDQRKGKEKSQVSALVAIIDEESRRGGNDAVKHRALRELEAFPNSEEAISVLVREIQFEPPMRSYKNLLGTYTAAEVLSQMGPRARAGLFKGISKPLSEPELYLRGVVLVQMDGPDGEWDMGREIALKRLRNRLAMVEKEVFPPGELTEQKAGIVFNLKRMISLIEDPRFSAGRIPNPDVPKK